MLACMHVSAIAYVFSEGGETWETLGGWEIVRRKCAFGR